MLVSADGINWTDHSPTSGPVNASELLTSIAWDGSKFAVSSFGDPNNASFPYLGAAIATHRAYRHVCVIDFAAGIEADKNLLLVTGAVPGHADGLLFVNTAVKGQPKAKQKQEERQRAKPKV